MPIKVKNVTIPTILKIALRAANSAPFSIPKKNNASATPTGYPESIHEIFGFTLSKRIDRPTTEPTATRNLMVKKIKTNIIARNYIIITGVFL